MKKAIAIIALITLYVVSFVLFNYLAVWLWSLTAVKIFGLPALTFWKMFGFRVLLHLLLGFVKKIGN